MDSSVFSKTRRLATKEELEEGRKQMEEAERRMRSEGLEVVDPRGGRLGSDGQFLGTVSIALRSYEIQPVDRKVLPHLLDKLGGFWKGGWWTSSST